MPIYEYRCSACGHRFERLQKMSDPDPDRCPECAAAEVERLISPVGFRLKGGGWYETDFKQAHRHNLAGEREVSGKKEKVAAEGAKDGGSKDGTAKEKTPEKSPAKQATAKKKPAASDTTA